MIFSNPKKHAVQIQIKRVFILSYIPSISVKSKSAWLGMIISTCCFSITESVGQPLPKDTTTVDQLYLKSKKLWTSNTDSAQLYLRQSNALARKIGYLRGEAYATYGLGVIEKVLY